MRFNKPSRKIRTKKKQKKLLWKDVSFFVYLAVGLLLVAAILYVFYEGRNRELRRVQQNKIQDDMDGLCSGLILYYQEHRRYPLPQDGLEALVKKPGAYLGRLPLDPWRNPYVYEVSSQGTGPRLICLNCAESLPSFKIEEKEGNEEQ